MITQIETPERLRELVGREVAVSDWVTVDQERIERFADATGDRQWIHLDRDRAEQESPYGTTIGHGFLTLSLLSSFFSSAVQFGAGLKFSVNYGLNRVRFPRAVPAGSRLRARFTLQSLEPSDGFFQAIWSAIVETEGGGKPCCVAEWVTRYYV